MPSRCSAQVSRSTPSTCSLSRPALRGSRSCASARAVRSTTETSCDHPTAAMPDTTWAVASKSAGTTYEASRPAAGATERPCRCRAAARPPTRPHTRGASRRCLAAAHSPDARRRPEACRPVASRSSRGRSSRHAPRSVPHDQGRGGRRPRSSCCETTTGRRASGATRGCRVRRARRAVPSQRPQIVGQCLRLREGQEMAAG